jgi:hypothetical protein
LGPEGIIIFDNLRIKKASKRRKGLQGKGKYKLNIIVWYE